MLMGSLWCPFLSSPSWSAGLPSVKSPESPGYPWVTSMAQQSHQHHKNMPGRKWDEKISWRRRTILYGPRMVKRVWWCTTPAICTAPNHISGCLGYVSSVTGAQWQSADRSVCLKSRDYPGSIPHLYSWCWAASALSLLLCLGTWSTATRQRPACENGASKGLLHVRGTGGKEPRPVLSSSSPVRTFSAATAFHASTVPQLS